jgi:RND family efflux transporter MFP subunit
MNMMKPETMVLAALMLFGVGGCGGSSVASSPQPVRPASASGLASIPAEPDTSGISEISTGDILSVLSVEHQVDVASESGGLVVSVAKDEGSQVKSGEILGQLDDRDLQFEIVKARDDLQVAQNNVGYKEAELKAKGAALDRQKQLRELGLSSEADLEAANFEAKAAEYDMHGWEAMAEASQAEIHRIEVAIDQTRLRAPFSGAVVERYVRQGQTVAKGDKCFRVSQLAPLQVHFQIPESAPYLKRGVPVNVVLVDNPNRSLHAQVEKISPVVDPASDSYDVTAELTGKGISDLRPGMAVRVVWPTARQTAR